MDVENWMRQEALETIQRSGNKLENSDLTRDVVLGISSSAGWWYCSQTIPHENLPRLLLRSGPVDQMYPDRWWRCGVAVPGKFEGKEWV
jgi:hypothetical protein